MVIRPEISIIVPVYNAVETLEKCVDSVLTQTFPNWELLLIDDGSMDGSVTLCEHYQQRDGRIVAMTQQHQGVSAARNLALSKARGRYVCFIDSDDFVDPDYLSCMYEHREADMVICGYYVDTYKDGTCIKQESHLPDDKNLTAGMNREVLLPLFMSGMVNINCNKLLRLDIIRNNDLNYKPQPVNEDYMFMLSYLHRAESVTTVLKPLYHWVRIEGKKTGVDSMPENLLELYNEAHRATESYFGNGKTADLCLYYSYNYLVLKYVKAFEEGGLAKEELKRKLDTFHHNLLVIRSYAAYQPKSRGEWLIHTLLKNGHFGLYRWLKKHIF